MLYTYLSLKDYMAEMTIFETISQPGVGTLLGTLISTLVSINTVLIKWLIGTIKELKQEIKLTSENTLKWLSSHELHDQSRHEENLYRFEKVSVALARLGSENGTHEHRKH